MNDLRTNEGNSTGPALRVIVVAQVIEFQPLSLPPTPSPFSAFPPPSHSLSLSILSLPLPLYPFSPSLSPPSLSILWVSAGLCSGGLQMLGPVLQLPGHTNLYSSRSPGLSPLEPEPLAWVSLLGTLTRPHGSVTHTKRGGKGRISCRCKHGTKTGRRGLDKEPIGATLTDLD